MTDTFPHGYALLIDLYVYPEAHLRPRRAICPLRLTGV